jgi:L-amino acid N-acyltransferase YncA
VTTVRAATAADAQACSVIYAPYVEDTTITFELTPPDSAEMLARMGRSFAWLVAEEDGEVLGYAYAGPYMERPAYRWSSQVSVYLRGDSRGRGLGTALYRALFAQLTERGFRTLVAGVTLPNPASVRLHESLGFEQIGIWRRIGWKAGAWHDVWWGQHFIGTASDPPAEPDTRLAAPD